MASNDSFLLRSYDFELPSDLIAQSPATPRDSSRLLVVDRARGSWVHRRFTDLPEYFGENDLLVANNTRVFKARLLGKRLRPEGDLGGGVEFVMLERQGPLVWEGLFKASAKYVPGLKFRIPTPDGCGLTGTLIRGVSESAHGTVVAEFDRDPVESGAGHVPLPHYIERGARASEYSEYDDESLYQTVYAKDPGSAAAPTAGLHFTDRVLSDLRKRKVRWEEVTLNVGLGTFRPVKVDDVREHLMHDERYEISPEVAQRISTAKKLGARITAVGTTSVRTLESAWRKGDSRLQEGMGRTALFIYPGSHEIQVVDRLITNFHLPRSTLLMLVCALGGRDLILSAYQEAVREKYRFFSYGDSMLIL